MPATATPPTVGFVGLGNIGRPMVGSLLRAGFDVTVRELREAAAAPVVAAGARLARSNRDLAEAADVIGIAVVNDAQLLALVSGEDGLAHLCRPGALLVVHSTVLPSTIETIGATLDARGIHLLDAQISGGDLRAESGDLAIMVGGERDQFDRCAAYFAALGRRTELMGGRGAGATAKLAVQTMAMGNWLIAMEAMRIIRAAGLDEKAFADFATDTTADSFVTRGWGNYDRVLREHPLAGTDDLCRFFDKDLYNAAALARDLRVYMPVTALGGQVLADAIAERITLATD